MWWLAAVLIPAAFAIWVAGNFVRARREARENILRKGVPVDAEITVVRGRRIDYRFDVPGWKQAFTGSARVAAGSNHAVGGRVRVRYLPGHPQISTPESERE